MLTVRALSLSSIRAWTMEKDDSLPCPQMLVISFDFFLSFVVFPPWECCLPPIFTTYAPLFVSTQHALPPFMFFSMWFLMQFCRLYHIWLTMRRKEAQVINLIGTYIFPHGSKNYDPSTLLHFDGNLTLCSGYEWRNPTSRLPLSIVEHKQGVLRLRASISLNFLRFCLSFSDNKWSVIQLTFVLKFN